MDRIKFTDALGANGRRFTTLCDELNRCYLLDRNNMSENRHTKCKNVPLEGLREGDCVVSKDGLNDLAYRHIWVEEGEAFIPASHFLAETKYENALEDDISCLNSADAEKYLTLENFPCSDEFYGTDTDFGISNTEAAPHGQCLDSMLQDHDKGQSLHEIGNLPSDCSDYLLERGFAEKGSHLQNDLHYGYCLGSLSSGYPQTLEVDSDADETLELTNTTNVRTDGTFDQNALCLGNASVCEFHDAFGSTFGQGAPVVDKRQLKQPILFGLSGLMDLDDTSNNLKNGVLPDENEDMIFLSSNELSEISCGSLTTTLDQETSVVKALSRRHADKDTVSSSILGTGRFRPLEWEGRDHPPVTRKRMRKPTRRYIEESSEVKSRECTERFGTPSISPQNKISHIGTHDIQWKRSGSTQLICLENSSTLSDGQMAFVVQPRRGRPRKNFTCIVKDLKGKKGHIQNMFQHKTVYGSILSKSENQDGTFNSPPMTQSGKYGARRKHHRLWTLTEVTKLIEGVSQYGVGRWTDIKRLLFSSSAYRTSVDLKDKWRNLLRASGAQMHGGKEFETRKKHLPGLVPQSMLRRVRDLAIIHPYPRKRISGVPVLAPALVEGKDAPCSNKKTMHR